MASTFTLEVLTPERSFYRGEVETVIIPALDGQIGILAGHSPMVTTIGIGDIRIKENGQWKEAVISNGFVEVLPDYTIILADSCEWPDEIDINRAKAAKERAQERLRQKESQVEYLRSQAALARALTRLKVTKKM